MWTSHLKVSALLGTAVKNCEPTGKANLSPGVDGAVCESQLRLLVNFYHTLKKFQWQVGEKNGIIDYSEPKMED